MKRVTQAGLCLSAFVFAYAPRLYAADDAHGHAEGAAEHAEGGSAGLPQFDPSSFSSQIFWLAVAFVILYAFFSKKTLPDISNVLENRRQHIQSDLDTAEDLRKQAEDIHQTYEKVIAEAQAATTGIYQESEQAIKSKAAAEMNAFYERSLEQIGATEKRIEQAKAEAMEDMSGIAAEIAAEVAEKIIGVSTDLDQAKNVVQSLHKQKAA